MLAYQWTYQKRGQEGRFQSIALNFETLLNLEIILKFNNHKNEPY